MNTAFGFYLSHMRLTQNLTQEALAAYVGCDPSVVAAVEKSLRPVPGNYLIAWANALKLSPEEIILMYVNSVTRKMCLDAGITPLFKVVPANWSEADDHSRHRPSPRDRNVAFICQRMNAATK